MVKEIMLRNIPYRDVRPIICGEENCVASHSFGPATRDYYLLHYVIRGKGEFQTSKGISKVEKGEIFVIRPYEITFYKADEDNPWHYIWIGFENEIELDKYFEEDVIKLPQAEHIFKSILKSEHLKKGREIYLCSKIYELLAQLEEGTGEELESGKVYVEQTKNYIAANYMKIITVELLAQKVGLNRSYFSRTFRQYEGQSPQQYLVEFRLEKAAELMGNYHYSPSEAAASVGYTDYFNFSKMFKKKYGIGPKYYIRSKD